MGMMPEEIEKQFGVTTASEFEEQMSEKKLPELSFVINEENENKAIAKLEKCVDELLVNKITEDYDIEKIA